MERNRGQRWRVLAWDRVDQHLIDTFARSLRGLNVTGLAGSNDATIAKAGNGRSSLDFETVLSVVGAVATSALGDIVKSDAREVTESTGGASTFVLGADVREDELLGGAASDLRGSDFARSTPRG